MHGCTSLDYVVFPKSSHLVKIEDEISKKEGQEVISFVFNNHDKFKGNVPTSISKWDTPGIPTENDLKCKYSINFGFVASYCIGITYDKNGKKEFKILDSVYMLI